MLDEHVYVETALSMKRVRASVRNRTIFQLAVSTTTNGPDRSHSGLATMATYA